MPASSPREIAYHVFAEIVHGRWVRLDVVAPSPQGAAEEARRLKFEGRLFIVKDAAPYEFDAITKPKEIE